LTLFTYRLKALRPLTRPKASTVPAVDGKSTTPPTKPSWRLRCRASLRPRWLRVRWDTCRASSFLRRRFTPIALTPHKT